MLRSSFASEPRNTIFVTEDATLSLLQTIDLTADTSLKARQDRLRGWVIPAGRLGGSKLWGGQGDNSCDGTVLSAIQYLVPSRSCFFFMTGSPLAEGFIGSWRSQYRKRALHIPESGCLALLRSGVSKPLEPDSLACAVATCHAGVPKGYRV